MFLTGVFKERQGCKERWSAVRKPHQGPPLPRAGRCETRKAVMEQAIETSLPKWQQG
jgi:hypothetical protein